MHDLLASSCFNALCGSVGLYRRGVPIVIASGKRLPVFPTRCSYSARPSSDDPGLYGYVDLSFDFYEALMSFGLDMQALKQTINNTFTYS